MATSKPQRYRVTVTTPLAAAEGFPPETYSVWAYDLDHAWDKANDRRECDSEQVLKVERA